jgi:hypothetical protein
VTESTTFVTGPRERGDTGAVESVADILQRELHSLISDWLFRVEQEPDLTCIPLSPEERTGHLPHLLNDVIARLRLDAGGGRELRSRKPRPSTENCGACKATR